MATIWTTEKEHLLLSIFDKEQSKGAKIGEAAQKASELLNVSPSGCQGRYYLIREGLNEKGKNNGMWSDEEEAILFDTVTKFIDQGKNVSQAFITTSHKIDRTPGQCRAHWEKLRTTELRQRQREEWTIGEDLKLLEILREQAAYGLNLRDACEVAAESLNRNLLQVLGRWQNKLKYEHEIEFETGCFPWSIDETRTLFEVVRREIKNGATLERACEAASKKLSRRTPDACNSWLNEFPTFKEALNIGKWTTTQEDFLAHVVLQGVAAGKSLDECCKEASEQMYGRTAKACSNRWRYYVMKRYKDKYIQAKKDGGRLQGMWFLL